MRLTELIMKDLTVDRSLKHQPLEYYKVSLTHCFGKKEKKMEG